MPAYTKLCDYIRSAVLIVQSLFGDNAKTIVNEIPYISQFASLEYAEKVIVDKTSAAEDPNWQKTGAATIDEYVAWVTTTCGMACTAMAIKHFLNKDIGTITLAKDAIPHGVYKNHDGILSGLQYREYVKWVPKYMLQADLYRYLTLSGIRHLLSQGKLVMVSVNPNIRGINSAVTNQVGGHIVLVTGYDTDTVTIHNPSGFHSNGSCANYILLNSDFMTYFAKRGIAIQPSV